MGDENLVMRAEIIYNHRGELTALREWLNEALVSDNRAELLNEVKLFAESLVAIHALERQAYGFR